MPTDTPGAMLVWKGDAKRGFCALTPFSSLYRVDRDGDHIWSATLSGGWLCDHPTLEAARAACEADYARRWREAGLVPAGDVGLSTSAAAALLLGLHREGALEQSGDEAAQVAIEEQGADLNAQPVVEAFLIVLAPPGAALAAAPLAPTPAATCVDEDVVRAGELLAASAVSADAIRAEIAWLVDQENEERASGEAHDGDGISELASECYGAAEAYRSAAARLSALLPKPAPQEESHDG